jgi:hypothetical protein
MNPRLLACALIALSACTSPSGDELTAATEACEPDSTIAEPLIGPEAKARTDDSFEAWALFFNTFPMRPGGEPIEIPVDTEIKIVWRVTGDGDLAIEALGPGDTSINPDWGPAVHGGSNWERPGDEWGTGWTFPEVGCWTFEVHRGDSTAQLSVDIHEGRR